VIAKQTMVVMRASLPSQSGPDERSLSSEEIYRRHAQRVARWAARLAGPALDVEDLVQEIFVQVHRSRDAFRGECQLTTWLYGITERVVLAKRRRERWRRMFRFSAIADIDPVAPGPTPAEALESRQSADLLYAGLERLRENYRTVLILFELEGLSGEEISALKGLRIATVWARLSRARAQLAREVERIQRSSSWR
jgi:RNA polymerase sigma-70 factor (ECF subfamily)